MPKITDEKVTFYGTLHDDLYHESLSISSNYHGTHYRPSIMLDIKNGYEEEPLPRSYGTDDPEVVKQIIRHMAKMAGLTVSFEEEPDE